LPLYLLLCLHSHQIEAEEGGGWTCLRCGEVVYKCRPWDGDVIVQQEKKSSSKPPKSVGFSVSNDESDERMREDSSEGTPDMVDSTLESSRWTMADDDFASG